MKKTMHHRRQDIQCEKYMKKIKYYKIQVLQVEIYKDHEKSNKAERTA